jgi:hypothetical protein
MAKPMTPNSPRQAQGNEADSRPAKMSGGQSSGQGGGQSREMDLFNDVTSYLRTYARERPDVAALWCFGVGFVLGWKLKPW